jgi:hypothetical protein
MTAKEKANELVDKMYNVDFHDDAREIGMRYPHAIKCALVAVDEIISTVNMCIPYLNEETYVKYWQEVKNEIEKL